VDLLAPRVGRATVALLERAGCQVEYPGDQTCCGQPAFNTGYRDLAQEVGARFCEVFKRALEAGEGLAAIVAPSSSCIGLVREHYVELGLAVPAPAFELCDYLVQVAGVTECGAALPARAALAPSCHLLRVLDGDGSVRRLLEGVAGLELVETGEERSCCGFGGTFSATQPDVSAAMGRVKLRAAREAGAEVLITTDVSCGLQLAGLAAHDPAAGYPQVVHVAEVLAGMVEARGR
jgi:L-lactate dehydrogenase complex protein LldE